MPTLRQLSCQPLTPKCQPYSPQRPKCQPCQPPTFYLLTFTKYISSRVHSILLTNLGISGIPGIITPQALQSPFQNANRANNASQPQSPTKQHPNTIPPTPKQKALHFLQHRALQRKLAKRFVTPCQSYLLQRGSSLGPASLPCL